MFCCDSYSGQIWINFPTQTICALFLFCSPSLSLRISMRCWSRSCHPLWTAAENKSNQKCDGLRRLCSLKSLLVGMFSWHINKIIVQMCQLAECHKKSFCSSRWHRVIYKRTRAGPFANWEWQVWCSYRALGWSHSMCSFPIQHTHICVYIHRHVHTHMCVPY